MDETDLLLCAIGLRIIQRRKNQKLRRRSMWARRWLLLRQRYSHINLLEELRLDPLDYRRYLRMTEDTYVSLLNLVTPFIARRNTHLRESISAHERLCATLRFLATGRSYGDLEFSCVMSKTSLSLIVPETCYAIYTVLKNSITFPSTTEEWLAIAEDFHDSWQFPHCLGAVDGKHIEIIPPPNSGSHYFNYKGRHSIVLMAIVNANCEFILADIGVNGRISDGGVINHTEFYKKLLNNQLKLPPPAEIEIREPRTDTDEDQDDDLQFNGRNEDESHLPRTSEKTKMILNHVFIGDEAFALRPNFLKPYPQKELCYEKRIYNYRHSRARRIVENAFGILANRFQIFRRPIALQLRHTKIVVLAACALHNMLRQQSIGYVVPEDMDFEDIPSRRIVERHQFDGSMHDLKNGKNRNAADDAKAMRDLFAKYFLTEKGKVSWQDEMILVN